MEIPFYYQPVSDPAELERFRLNYFAMSGNDLDLAYLRQGVVYQFYIGYRPVAGFILNTIEMGPLRYFSYLDDDVYEQLLDHENLRAADFLEITANYKAEELDDAQDRFYYNVMLTEAYRMAKKLKKTYLLGGSIIKKVKLIQQALMDRVIYHGPISEAKHQAVHDENDDDDAILLKIYAAEVAGLPLRVVIVITNRYFIQKFKNNVKRWLNGRAVQTIPPNA